MRGIDHDHVDTGICQCLDAFFGALAHADGRTGAQLTLRIARCIRTLGGLLDILDRHQAA
ncbi:hypothetical protein GALL_547850 [mine drainage metagenome]|uniref:Uncharacterized protein n=1 Tax=mine drainage metagenome TaxID=410659 RepID=A0A1J5PEL0_9ZZZZ